ncbi:hypothetical protein J2S21_003430 [Peribacillus cavernae]|nr:hypothetical protein [Peribacillus cavernae]
MSHIDDELEIEGQERVKYINLIFMLSKEVEKPKIITRKKPLLFRNSMKIFKRRTPGNGFLELFIKVFFRNGSFIFSYYQLLSVTLLAVFLLPSLWLKVPVFAGFIIMMSIWLSNIYDKVLLTHPFTKKYEGREAYLKAKHHAVMIFLIPAVLTAGVALLIVLFLF